MFVRIPRGRVQVGESLHVGTHGSYTEVGIRGEAWSQSLLHPTQELPPTPPRIPATLTRHNRTSCQCRVTSSVWQGANGATAPVVRAYHRRCTCLMAYFAASVWAVCLKLRDWALSCSGVMNCTKLLYAWLFLWCFHPPHFIFVSC